MTITKVNSNHLKYFLSIHSITQSKVNRTLNQSIHQSKLSNNFYQSIISLKVNPNQNDVNLALKYVDLTCKKKARNCLFKYLLEGKTEGIRKWSMIQRELQNIGRTALL